MIISHNSLAVAINRKDISMVRGNTGNLRVGLKENGERAKLVTGDTVYFSIKKNANDRDFALQKKITSFGVLGVADITFSPEDTKHMEAGDYLYDIRLDLKDGTVTTLIETSNFVLREAIMYD